jgi:rhamnogalacturonan endolyase
VIVAWDWRNGQVTQRWVFDSNTAGSTYEGRGNHQLSIADVDGDGRQESVPLFDRGSAGTAFVLSGAWVKA